MTDDKPNDTRWIDPDWPLAEDGNPVINIVIPRAFQSDVEGESWRPGTPIRLLSQLASDHFFKQATLTREQLAELVELFKDEPLPESLRAALVDELNGQRCRKQGRKHARQTGREQVELFMLPAVYDEAMKDAADERERLKSDAKNQPRRASVAKIPTHRSIALGLVRQRLPSLARMSDQRLTNLVSEVRAMLRMDDATEPKQVEESGSD